ncbi:MAG: GDP-mannose 4,6-dehydratase, partial [Planctomycetota bacterium]
GDGTTSRDYTFVADIVDGILATIDRDTTRHPYRIYNLGGSSPVSLSELVAGIEAAVGKKADLDRQPGQPGDVSRTFADLTRAKAEIGYEPKVSLREGLERFVAWYREFGHLYTLPGEA